MDREHIAQLRVKAALLYQQGRQWTTRVPVKARVVIGLFFVAALLMAVHTALTAKDSSLHLKLQHGFHKAQVSVWVDGDLAYSGKLSGSTKKRFGLIPTDSVQGSLSEIIPVRSGQRQVRLRVEPDDASLQEDTISGDFPSNSERDLSVSAKQSGLVLTWVGESTSPAETSTIFGWISRYAGSLLLTIAGSIISALAGYAIRELPARLRPTPDSAPNPDLGPQ